MSKLDNFNSKNRDSGGGSRSRERVDPNEYLRDLDRKKPPLPFVSLPRDADASDVDRALKKLKSAVQKSGLAAETRKRRFYTKPSEERQEKKRKKSKAIAKARAKEERKNAKP